ncbi:M23 family metallopeptidase [Sphingomonas mollis]|uniref:M23 family metallopeptidase n=1 Tax=Sphingomonas mollis TaxID=2795726 RepID=A0ABS0XP13_9SPHN|nr:M23 family metallopeptidase [Sphingomonas sp. BT553]MBJ6121784.1 M23 family metallopeptidase [Sphingomonas sp. BT553]
MARRWAASVAMLALAGCIPSVEPPRGSERMPPPRHEEPPAPPMVDDRPARSIDVPAPRPARPAWEAKPVAADTREVAASTYTVRRGDGLGAIAERTGASVEAIARANGLAAPYPVQAGRRLTIPAGRYHLVRPGESGIAIARAYGVEWSRIVAANELTEPYSLRAGQRVLIPGPAESAPSRAAERAAAFRLDVDDILTGGEPALAANQAPVRPVRRPTRALPSNAVVAPPVRLAGGGFVWPVEGRVVKRFGPGASGERNDGIKLAVPVGTPVLSVADGVVAYAGDGIAALGGLVIVKHGGGWTSVYGHASRLLVSRGQSVKRGQSIALSGDTGFAEQPEVHFELRRGRTPVDPLTLLPRR